ncbi:WXG100 family type VII secretion target [Amycolatopsis benzoatilytica]|uniref:WXG100 family type VII secretion target n=1 Tax=Amycolatopsis benzoatilytica TaxID=346045 RepID=UPI00039F58CA|nr:WXG100 family type VII secretion target [Amycolatopsis benzoatilytica]
MDGKQIFDNFRGGDTAGLRAAAAKVQELSAAYLERAHSVKDLQERMARSWTGDTADAAKAGAGPLERNFRESADPLDLTSASMDTQAGSFESARHAVVEVPPRPERPQPWAGPLQAVLPASAAPVSFQDGIDRFHGANENNVRVMEQYHGVTVSTKSALPKRYGLISPAGSAIRRTTSDGTSVQASHDRGGPAGAAVLPVPEPAPRGAGPAVAGGPVAAGGPGDGVHRRPEYLVEADPEAAFGPGGWTPRPVLGDEEA